MEQLPRDALRPLARAIADALSYSKFIGGVWDDYHVNEALRLEAQTSDTTFCYRRTDARGHVTHKSRGRTEHAFARIVLADLQYLPVNPAEVEYGDLIVLDRVKRADQSLRYDNTNGDDEAGPLTWHKEFANGETEMSAIDASWSVENITKASVKATAGIGIAEASAEASTETRAKLAGAWSRQTGRTESDVESFSHSQMVSPGDLFEARLEWEEVTQKLPWKAPVRADCRIEMGKFQDYRDGRGHHRRWVSGDPTVFDSIDDLIAVMERRGSVDTPGFEHFAAHPPHPALIPRIQAARTVWMEQTTAPFKGAGHIELVVLE